MDLARAARLLACPALAAGAALLPAVAAADTRLRAGDTFSVAAHGGDLAWSEVNPRGGGRSLLYALVDGEARRLRAPSSQGLIDVDLGARGRSGTRAVFQRCPAIRRCDLFRLDLPDGRARLMRSLSSTRRLEVAPSVWGSTYVFGRIRPGEPQVGRSRGGGLFAKVGRRPLRRLTSRVPIDTDVRGRRIALAHWTPSGGSAIYTTTTAGRRLCRVERGTRARFVRAPVLDGEHVHWLRFSARTGDATVARSRVPDGRCRGRGGVETSRKDLPEPPGGAPGGVDSIAVDGGSFFYSAGGIFAADDPPPFP